MFVDSCVSNVLHGRKAHSALLTFVQRVVEKEYRDAPFHNCRRGVAALQFSYVTLLQCESVKRIVPLEFRLAMLVAALAMDIDHPGHTNSFHVNSRSEYAILYNDRSVLEKYVRF